MALTSVTAQQEHQPTRPAWDCDTCPGNKPWPCDPAREWLRRRYADGRESHLAVEMQRLMYEAIRDRPTLKSDELHERFISWTG